MSAQVHHGHEFFICCSGLVAERCFGFKGVVSTGEVDIERDHANARALGNSLLVCPLVPWSWCILSSTGILLKSCATCLYALSWCACLSSGALVLVPIVLDRYAAETKHNMPICLLECIDICAYLSDAAVVFVPVVLHRYAAVTKCKMSQVYS